MPTSRSRTSMVLRPIPRRAPELWTVSAGRGAVDHLAEHTTLLLLHDGALGLGPPRHMHDVRAGQAVLLPAHHYIARRVLSPQAHWQAVQLEASIPGTAPVYVPWPDAVACAARVRQGQPAAIALPTTWPTDWVYTPRLERARRLLHEQAHLGLSVEELSEQTGAPPHVLNRTFRRELGTTPSQYQLLRRLCLARRYLRDGLAPSDAALRAGFYDQSHLGRHMRRRLGITPAAYARGHHTTDVADIRARTNVPSGRPR